jgi:imidazoleglycerol phosphate synthase glutamine amidotransferase subunit HisH
MSEGERCGTTIDVVDYGGGNLGSALRCLTRLGVEYRLVNGRERPTGENPLLFPGVGAFGAAMANLARDGFADCLRELIRGGTPYLGICIGLQVLFEGSEEAPDTPGLGLLSGRVTRFRQGKVPQIGWNRIELVAPPHPNPPPPGGRGLNTSLSRETSPLPPGGGGLGWGGFPQSGYVYFVNSYYPELADPADALYQADYHGPFTAAAQRDNITAFQFHPEKSGPFGQTLIQRWLNDVR